MRRGESSRRDDEKFFVKKFVEKRIFSRNSFRWGRRPSRGGRNFEEISRKVFSSKKIYPTRAESPNREGRNFFRNFVWKVFVKKLFGEKNFLKEIIFDKGEALEGEEGICQNPVWRNFDENFVGEKIFFLKKKFFRQGLKALKLGVVDRGGGEGTPSEPQASWGNDRRGRGRDPPRAPNVGGRAMRKLRIFLI